LQWTWSDASSFVLNSDQQLPLTPRPCASQAGAAMSDSPALFRPNEFILELTYEPAPVGLNSEMSLRGLSRIGGIYNCVSNSARAIRRFSGNPNIRANVARHPPAPRD
jgi:hypothetical protein